MTRRAISGFEQCVVTVRGDLDQALFAQTWQRVAARHAILRASLHSEGLEKPVHVVDPEAEVPVESLDWRRLQPDIQQSRLDAFLREDRNRSFDLTSPPLLRVTLVRTGEDVHECVLCFQHLLLDRRSCLGLLEEVLAEYATGGRGEGARLPFRRAHGEYTAWLQQQDPGGVEAFWRSSLAGFTTPTSFASDRRSLKAHGTAFEEASLRLSKELSAKLQSFATRNQLTINTIVQGAWAVLASRYSGEDEVLFGATVSGRPASLPDVDSVAGLFINTLPVRVRVSAEERVLPWLQKLEAQLLELQQYAHSELVDIQGWSDVPRGTPLFESLVVFENVGHSGFLGASRPLEVLRVRSVGDGTNYPLTLLVTPGVQLSLRILADRGLFNQAAVPRMLGHLATLLEAMVADAERQISSLPLVTEPERRQLLFEWNDPGYNVGETRCLFERFEEQVERSHDAIAVEFEKERLSYRELNLRANKLAWHLRKLGVGPNVLVGVCLERSTEMVVALIAVLKAGGAYVPLDPAYPRERLTFMLEDAQTPILLTERRFQESLSVPRGVRVCPMDRDGETIARETERNPDPLGSSDSLAYVIYTSGSTGKPKGVPVTHGNVDRLFTATQPWFQFDGHDVWTLFHSYAFDFSVWELWGALRCGGRLVVVPQWVARSPEAFRELLARSGVTVLNQTPSAFRQLIAHDVSSAAPLRLRLIIFGGEALEPGMLKPWFDRHGDEFPRLVNMYGITETTVHTTYHPVTRRDLLHPAVSVIGRPIPDLQVYILDRQLQLCPTGVAGELHVAGAGLARGYLRRPELTRERFIPNPFATRLGERLYKSGDLGRYLPDGEIEYLGRIDHQIKIRGHRIEPGEIESRLREHPAVREAVVIAREDAPGDRRLVAYLVRSGGAPPPDSEIRAFLERVLPDFMVPSAFVPLEAIPLTSNDKVDRRALPPPDQSNAFREGAFPEPRNAIEEVLAKIWSQLLRIGRIGIESDFFALGGDSILATQMISCIRDAFRIELPLRALFEGRTIAGLAKAIEGAQKAGAGSGPSRIRPVSREAQLRHQAPRAIPAGPPEES